MKKSFLLNIIMIIQIPILFCKRCSHKWIPRSTKSSLECPNCKSRKWQEEKGAKDDKK